MAYDRVVCITWYYVATRIYEQICMEIYGGQIVKTLETFFFAIISRSIGFSAVQNEPVGFARSQGQEGSTKDRVVLTPPSQPDDESASVTPRSTHGHADETKGKRCLQLSGLKNIRSRDNMTVLYMHIIDRSRTRCCNG